MASAPPEALLTALVEGLLTVLVEELLTALVEEVLTALADTSTVLLLAAERFSTATAAQSKALV